MFRSISVAVAILVMSGATARAESEDRERSGPYVGVGGTWATYFNAEDEGEDAGFDSVDVDDPFGVNARVGYRFLPAIAGEVHFEWLSTADIDTSVGNLAELDVWTLTANLKVYFLARLLHEFEETRYQPYLMLGGGVMHGEFDDQLGLGLSDDVDSFAARPALGIDVYITPSILGNLELGYVYPASQDLHDFDYLSVGAGIQYRF